MALRAVVTFNSEGLGAAAKGAVTPQILERAEEAGQFMARRANEMMAADFDMNRPYERRRWPGSPRAAGVIDYFVEQRGEDVVFGFANLLSSDETTLKLLGLNYGTGGGHTIEPSGNWPLSDGIPKALAWPDDSEKGYRSQKIVNHPGSRGTLFFQRARDEAVQRFISRR